MPSEKRALDTSDPGRSSNYKRSKRDDRPRDWRVAHLNDGRHRRYHDSPSRDRSLDKERDRDMSHRDRHFPSAGRRFEKNASPLLRDDSSPKGAPSFTKPPPTGPKAVVAQSTTIQHVSSDEREEGEISPRPAADSMMEEDALPTEADQSELEIVEEKPIEDDAEARKARRAAILEKYRATQAAASSGTGTGTGTGASSMAPAVVDKAISLSESLATPPPTTPFAMGTGAAPSPIVGPQEDGQFLLTKDPSGQSLISEQALNVREQTDGGVEGVVAADYDPSQDMKEDVKKAAQKANEEAMDGSEESSYEEGDNMEDDIDDMFALADETEKPEKKKKKKKKKAVKKPVAVVADNIDTAADEEGYYQIIFGEFLDGGRYQVFALVGKGMFSIVVKARVFDPEGDKEKPIGEVAIKIVRSQESMYKAGIKEAQILQKLRQSDLEDKKHLVKLEKTFEHRGHLCLVFESLSMNLRDTVKKYGRDVGLHLKAVRVYAHQLFLALSLLRKCTILHADIKPDNILINESRSNLKLCDLGSATDISIENTSTAITPYLVSRFYRAPEIILGMPYDYSVDTWSMGCTLYELYTGRILFPGRSNREMIKLMMEAKGRFNQKLVKKAKFGDVYFDDGGGFWDVVDGVGVDMNKKLHFLKPSRDLRSRLLPHSRAGDGTVGTDEKDLLAFIDLLDKCLHLDPARRITPKEALLHPFIRGN